MIGGARQRAIYAALASAPAVADGRVYDRPPAPKVRMFPDITIGDEQVIEDGTTCGDGWLVYADVHIWSQPESGSKLEAKDLAPAVVARLDAPLAVAGFRVIDQGVESARTIRDPDGITEHGILTFRYELQPA